MNANSTQRRNLARKPQKLWLFWSGVLLTSLASGSIAGLLAFLSGSDILWAGIVGVITLVSVGIFVAPFWTLLRIVATSETASSGVITGQIQFTPAEAPGTWYRLSVAIAATVAGAAVGGALAAACTLIFDSTMHIGIISGALVFINVVMIEIILALLRWRPERQSLKSIAIASWVVLLVLLSMAATMLFIHEITLDELAANWPVTWVVIELACILVGIFSSSEVKRLLYRRQI